MVEVTGEGPLGTVGPAPPNTVTGGTCTATNNPLGPGGHGGATAVAGTSNNTSSHSGTSSSSSSTMYATKRRRRSVKTVKTTPMKDPPKSNPSKRHRLRLNAELDHLASLLPFEQSVISRLDRLSILRLGVSYLRTKSHFQNSLHERYSIEGHHHISSQHHIYGEPSFTDTDSVLQALNGFMFVVTDDGEVFFASRTVEQYLGFHQSDIIHQSALELIHSEDRENFKAQLNWRSQLPGDRADITLQDALSPDNCHLLNRTFTVRFRCLLDNTSGFITLEISGHMKMIHGQNLKAEASDPVLALFAICCPFGPLPMLDVPPRDYTFKSKHKMDLAPLSMDHRGKLLFGFTDHELQEKGGYDLIHPDDLSYYAAAHQELIKTGSSGLIAYRLLTKDFRWMWLQTSTKVIYKNSKPDFVICTHRHLTDDEGRDLVGKRGTEFKLPYPIIDTDLTGLGSPIDDELTKLKSPRGKKSKNQLRDYLQTGRKRKTPYRECYNGLNGYSAYTAFNGYTPSNGTSDIKPELLYPYGNTYGLESDLYRTAAAAPYGSFTGSVYPTTDSFRLDADKHAAAAYGNGYYFDSRQYQHSLPYTNGYADYIGTTGSKYGYDISKYGYDMSGYGLDLSKRGVYDEELVKYESDLRKYDYSGAADKLSRVNGAIDPLKSSSLYGSAPLLNNDSLLSCSSMPHTASPCSLYRSDAYGAAASAGAGTQDMRTPYASSTVPTAASTGVYDHKGTSMKMPTIVDPSSVPGVASSTEHSKLTMPNGHTSVIRNPTSPRSNKPSNCTTNSSAMYPTSSSGSGNTCDVTPCEEGNPSPWTSCNKLGGSGSSGSINGTIAGVNGGSGSCITAGPGVCKSPLSHPGSEASQSSQSLSHSDLVSPQQKSGTNSSTGAGKTTGDPLTGAALSTSMTSHGNSSTHGGSSSPASATTATSVIQQSGRIRSYDRQTPSTPTAPTSSVSAPMGKGSGGGNNNTPGVGVHSSWLSHPATTPASHTSAYDWSISAGMTPDPSPYAACQQRVPYYSANESTHISRGVIETPKVVCYNEAW